MTLRLLAFASVTAVMATPALLAQVPAPTGIRIVDRTVVRTVERATNRVMAVYERAQRGSEDPCREQRAWDDRHRICEVREYTLPAGPLTVDAGRNGGVQVEASNRANVRIRAIVTAHADSEADARQLAAGVQVQTGSGTVSATGPTAGRDEGWSVSFRIEVPRDTDLNLTASNGGISITGVHGTIRFATTNGGVRLVDLAGDVRGETRNGGVTVNLGGQQWDGAGLDVETTNGGVTLAVPDNYSADLTTRTSNGGFRSDLPLNVTGEISPRRGLSATLGSGGAPVNVRTSNGGVRITRR